MIPRTKVNFGWADLAKALVAREGSRERGDRLRSQLREHLGGGYVELTASGRGAIYFLLRALDRPFAVTPAYTCKAVLEAIRFAGKSLVSVAVDPAGFQMDVAALDAALAELPHGSATILATHQYGEPCDIHAILAVARRHDALVLEDAAGALGARIGGRPVGSFGDAAAFSFDCTKLLHAPLKAGAAWVRDADHHARLASLLAAETRPMTLGAKLKTIAQGGVLLLLENGAVYRVFHWLMFGRGKRFMFDAPGMQREIDAKYSGRCAEWQARIVGDQFARLEEYVAASRCNEAAYRAALAGCRRFEIPEPDGGGARACVRFPIFIRGDKLRFYRQCAERGVDLAFSFTFLGDGTVCPRALELAERVVNLPFYAKLASAERERVVEVLRELENADGDEDSRPLDHGPESDAAQGAVFDARLLECQGRGAR